MSMTLAASSPTSIDRTACMSAHARALALMMVAAGLTAACEEVNDPANNNAANNNVGNNNTNNNNTGGCPAVLPTVATTCDDATCAATTGTRTVAVADLPAAQSGRWLIVSHAGSDLFDNQNLTFDYTRERLGGLRVRPADNGPIRRRSATLETLLEAWGPEAVQSVLGDGRRARIAAERALRAASPTGPLSLDGVTGTAIRRRIPPGLPPGVSFQPVTCSRTDAACGSDALCVIPEGDDSGTCASNLTIKFRPDPSQPAQFDSVASTVRAVGQFGAIVVDDADGANLSDADVTTLLDRFERRIAPLDHALFGQPQDAEGNDRDGNGVVILFITSRVGQIDANLAGFFQSLDLRTEGEAPSSNAADILYLQPPGPTISLDQLSGTIGHEYQHLINYYAKVIRNGSSPESVWLDEGLSTFAEDILGYGSDAFRNVAAYLVSVADTSLTGFGLINTNNIEADSLERRGMAHLLVRYYFEQAGGATFPTDPGGFTDDGGIAAVNRLVASPDTGIDAFAGSGRSFAQWVQDLLTVVAIDGADIPNVSCNPDFTFAEPEIDGFTGFQRGIDLRATISVPGGVDIPLNGPTVVSFEAESVPVPLNGGEIRTLDTPTGTTRIGLIGPADEDITLGLRILPQ